MLITQLLYLKDFNLLKSNATVLDVYPENDRFIVILDETIFYPQGGGQPYDTGSIRHGSNLFVVQEVRFLEGIVKHIGIFDQGAFVKGEEIECLVDGKRRLLHSRLHSGGHVVDMAVAAFKLNWIPVKGHHFPDGPYVEYAGSLEGFDREKLKSDLESKCTEFINEQCKTQLIFMDKKEMATVCHHVPDYLPADKPSRVVLYGKFGVPCGGTHVNQLGEIGKIIIRNIKQSGQTVRVGYQIEELS